MSGSAAATISSAISPGDDRDRDVDGLRLPLAGGYPVTPDGRYFVVRGRVWRMSDPRLAPDERDRLVADLMTARRDVGTGRRSGNNAVVMDARGRVDVAKRALGERGAPWWDDGAPDLNRQLVQNTAYAEWFAGLADG